EPFAQLRADLGQGRREGSEAEAVTLDLDHRRRQPHLLEALPHRLEELGLRALPLCGDRDVDEPADQLRRRHRSPFRSTRLSPMRSVSFSRSKYSSSGMANLRVSPVSSLNDCASTEPCSARCASSLRRRSSKGVAANQRSSLIFDARPACASAFNKACVRG